MFHNTILVNPVTDPPRHCKHCGTKLIATLIGAENLTSSGLPWPFSVRLETAYNFETEHRQLVYHYKCPNKKWWNRCDNFIDYDTLVLSDRK